MEHNLLSDSVDHKTWKGYVVKNLEELNITTKELADNIKELNKRQIDKEDFEKLLDKFHTIVRRCDDCEIDDVLVAVYGDKEGKSQGILEKFSNLETAFKVKSSLWGILGGGIVSALSGVVYLLIKYGLPNVHTAKGSVTTLTGQ